jgi:predicted DCC family thiol-disulfide oxidoreductase YuxK
MGSGTDDLARPIVLYDGECPLCRREIAHYRRLDRGGRVIWADLTREHRLLDDLGVSPGEAMARLHVLDGEGHWHRGAFGFVMIWSRLPYYRALAWLLSRTGLTPALDRLYDRFARWRLTRRCDGVCDAPTAASGQGRS